VGGGSVVVVRYATQTQYQYAMAMDGYYGILILYAVRCACGTHTYKRNTILTPLQIIIGNREHISVIGIAVAIAAPVCPVARFVLFISAAGHVAAVCCFLLVGGGGGGGRGAGGGTPQSIPHTACSPHPASRSRAD